MDKRPEAAGSAPVKDSIGRRRAWLIWAVGAAFMVGLLALFYPKTTIIADEVHDLSVSQYLLSGKAFDRSSEAWFWKTVPYRNEVRRMRTLFAPRPAFAAMMIPFVAAGWHSAFVFGTLVHVLGFGGMIYVLRRRGLDPLWALLYLLHPTLVLYSRTVMADVLSASLVVLTLVFLHLKRPKHFLAGLVMGFLILLKISNFAFVAAFGLTVFVRDMTWRWSKEAEGRGGIRFRWLAMGLGILPGLVGLLLINSYFFDSPLGHGYLGKMPVDFTTAYFFEFLLSYSWTLMLVYPLMLVSPVLLKGPYSWEMKLSCLGVLLFFCFYDYLESGNSVLEMAIRTLRYHLTVLPFYLVAYAGMLTWLVEKARVQRFLRVGLASVAVLLFVGDGVMSRRLFEYSGHLASRQEALDRILPSSGTVVSGTKYLSAVTHPELRVLYGWTELENCLQPEDLPVLFVLERGEDVRTEARRGTYDKVSKDLVARVREHFEVRAYDRSVDGVEIYEVVRKLP